MAGFKMHMTTSTVLGVGYGAAGYAMGLPPTACVLGGGLCSVSGMLPDLDSDSGIPLRETTMLAAAVVPMLMLDRFREFGLEQEEMVLAAGLIYLFIRFVVAEIFKRFTVHRGMWHSIPAAAIAGLGAYLICSCEHSTGRLFKAGGVVLGFLSHLVLDEIYSIDVRRARLKKSFGTALKFFSKNPWANFSTYAKLAIVMGLVFGDGYLMDYYRRARSSAEQIVEKLRPGEGNVEEAATRVVERFRPQDGETRR